jgi:hypothetical protein|tara:strand:- start:356 stop:997 length:642 start_codon:yes stop_codon:yes gene_type:complete
MKIYKPKAEFEQAINIQNTYVELLKNYHKELSDKIKKSKGYDLAKYQLKMYETATKLDEQIELLREKLNHFDKNFINQYNEELKECEENFDSLLKDAFKDLKNHHRVWMKNLNDKIKDGNEVLKSITEKSKKQTKFSFSKDLELTREYTHQLELNNKIESFINGSDKLLENKKQKIEFYITDWQSVSLKDRNHIEVKNVLYKDLLNLVTFPEI